MYTLNSVMATTRFISPSVSTDRHQGATCERLDGIFPAGRSEGGQTTSSGRRTLRMLQLWDRSMNVNLFPPVQKLRTCQGSHPAHDRCRSAVECRAISGNSGARDRFRGSAREVDVTLAINFCT